MPAPDEPIHHAHDKLFRAGFGDPTTAATFLRSELPAKVAKLIDWTQLRLENSTFIDSAFRRSESDLLFSAPMGDQGESLVYLLFEHQTSEEPLLALRLLRYMVRIWETWLACHPQAAQLPPIIPVVLAQNAQKWSISTHFTKLVALPDPEFASFTPSFCFRLIELATLPFEAIRGTPAGIMILRTMKAERLAQLLADPVWDEALLTQIPAQIHEFLIRYMLGSNLDFAGFKRRVQMLHQRQLRSTTMTLAEQILQQGRAEGRAEARAEVMREAVVDLVVARWGKVPAALANHLASLEDQHQLKELLKRAGTCASLEELTGSI